MSGRNMPRAADSELVREALHAVAEMAARLGAGRVKPVLLHNSRHVSILLPEMDAVARVRDNTAGGAAASLRRELAVVRHLSENSAPVVTPCTRYPAGPHVQARFTMTLWRFVKHAPLDCDDAAQVASAAQALRAVHRALADFPDDLPPYTHKIDECAALLVDESRLTALADADRAFLSGIHTRLAASLGSFQLEAVPIHGDAHAGNVFMTDGGALWTDFESACLGPPEWDAGFLPALAEPRPIDREPHELLADLRSFCVSVWCWDLAHMPQKREAAEYHLDRLKRLYGAS
jgi:aminoglycoside phosphotransferase (APT) family kinase protein